MHRGVRWLLRTVRRLLADQRGNAAIIFGFSVLPLMAATGLAVDTALAYNAESALQRSLDAAGLAAGRAMDTDNVESDARSFFDSNFASVAGLATLTEFDVDPSEDGSQITLSATATLPTNFMQIFGHDLMTVTARTVVNREVRQMELALVLDNTGSMWGSPFDTMKAAAHELVNTIYGEAETHPNLYVAVVPYVATVNIGSSRTSWLESTDPVRTGNPYSPSTWKGCVMARTNGYDETDDPPSVRKFRSFLYPDSTDNDWGSPRNPRTNESLSARNAAYGPNLGCGPTITPLVAERTRVHAALDAMGPWSRGGTQGNLGLVWGWAVLSPRWRGLWGGNTPNELPLDYNSELSDKIVVMLTDGNNEVYDWLNKWDPNRNGIDDWCGYEKQRNYYGGNCPFGTSNTNSDFVGPRGSDYTSYGRLNDFPGAPSTISAGKTILDQKMTRICTAMKQQGIIIYTITFGSVPSSATQTLYRNCATQPAYYFHAPDNATLRTAFRQVGM
jgi:Flp pilus assembly protein TadG